MLEMPQRDGARAAKTVLSSALRAFATYWTELCVAIAEVFPVFFAVTRDAQRQAIGGVKPQCGVFRPGLSVVGVELADSATSLAGVVVSVIHRLSPTRETVGQSSTRAAEGFTILPGVRSWACAVFAGARARAEHLLALIRGELLAAGWAGVCFRWPAFGPAGFGAPLGSIGSVSFDAECVPTHKAGFGDLIWFAHRQIIPQQQNERKFGTLERLAGMGLEPRLVVP